MPQKILSLFLLLTFTACASSHVAQKGPYKPKPFVTPYEYYSKARPAVMTDKDKAKLEKVASQPMGDDTKEDHHTAIIVGTLVGVAVVGGVVTTVLLVK